MRGWQKVRTPSRNYHKIASSTLTHPHATFFSKKKTIFGQKWPFLAYCALKKCEMRNKFEKKVRTQKHLLRCATYPSLSEIGPVVCFRAIQSFQDYCEDIFRYCREKVRKNFLRTFSKCGKNGPMLIWNILKFEGKRLSSYRERVFQRDAWFSVTPLPLPGRRT